MTSYHSVQVFRVAVCTVKHIADKFFGQNSMYRSNAYLYLVCKLSGRYVMVQNSHLVNIIVIGFNRDVILQAADTLLLTTNFLSSSTLFIL